MYKLGILHYEGKNKILAHYDETSLAGLDVQKSRQLGVSINDLSGLRWDGAPVRVVLT